MKNILIRAVIAILLAAAALCGFLFYREYGVAQEEISEYTTLRDEYSRTTYKADQPPQNFGGDENRMQILSSETEGLPYTVVDFDALLLENPDTVGWLAISESTISYPVVQAQDNEKYLDISFGGKRSSTGTPFADMDNNMQNLDDNTIIHGHNMGAGRDDMFGSLLNYKDSEYYAAHRYIQFDTIYQRHGWWKVFAVIYLDTRSSAFPYMQTQFDSEEGFNDWIATAQSLSLHKADTDIGPYSRILTLSTCDRSKYGRNGRLLVLATKI